MFNKKEFEQNEVNGVLSMTCTNEDVFKNGTDIPFKTIKEVDAYRAKYLEEATEFATKEAKSIMESNNKINKVIVTVPFSSSKRGTVDISVDRSKTFQGMNGSDPVTKSKVTVVVTDPINKVSKSRIKELETELTKVLIK